MGDTTHAIKISSRKITSWKLRRFRDYIKMTSGKYVVRMGGGWNWLRTVSNSRLSY
jgi:RES domain-containing protein